MRLQPRIMELLRQVMLWCLGGFFVVWAFCRILSSRKLADRAWDSSCWFYLFVLVWARCVSWLSVFWINVWVVHWWLFDLTFCSRDMAPQSWGGGKVAKMEEKTNFWTKRDRKTCDTANWPSERGDHKKYTIDRAISFKIGPARPPNPRDFLEIAIFSNFAGLL